MNFPKLFLVLSFAPSALALQKYNIDTADASNCEECAEKFFANGGCTSLANHDDVIGTAKIPTGCDSCEEAAMAYCEKAKALADRDGMADASMVLESTLSKKHNEAKPTPDHCPSGHWTQLGGIGDDVPGWGLVADGNQAATIEDCAAQCDAREKCGAFEYHGTDCCLNTWEEAQESKQNKGTVGNAITCKKPIPDLKCPAGHWTQLGDLGDDVPGWGLVPEYNQAESMEDCAAQCDAKWNCGSFEYHWGDCCLNNWDDSKTERQNKGTVYLALTCKRPEPTCPSGHWSQLGEFGDDVPGWGLVGDGNQAVDIEDCARQCDAHIDCLAFEYKGGDCPLMGANQATTAAQTGHVSGELTCVRPPRTFECPSGWTQLGDIGDDVPGWGLVADGNQAASMEDCAAQCKAKWGCGSFEYKDGDCCLNPWDDSTTDKQNKGTVDNAITCKHTPPTCPSGKWSQLGEFGDDVPGWGIVAEGNKAESLAACAAQCDENSDCCSFEYTGGDCVLMDAGQSTEEAQTGHVNGLLACKKPCGSPTPAATPVPPASPTPVATPVPPASPTPVATPAPPVSPISVCEGLCETKTHPWETKCRWKKCAGCSDCGDTDTPGCMGFCGLKTHPWATKCQWKKCSGCSDCGDTDTPGCMGFCGLKTHPWATKCKWKKCSSCSDCSTATPAPATPAPTAPPTAPPTFGDTCMEKPCYIGDKSVETWDTKCRWPKCLGCSECGVQTDTCQFFCTTRTEPITNTCNQAKCAGCSFCD